VIFGDEVGDVIRETGYRRSGNVQIKRNAGDRGTQLRPISELRDRGLDRIDEGRVETWTLVVVPNGRCVELGGGFRRESNRQAH
jgi:hypothetical protein